MRIEGEARRAGRGGAVRGGEHVTHGLGRHPWPRPPLPGRPLEPWGTTPVGGPHAARMRRAAVAATAYPAMTPGTARPSHSHGMRMLCGGTLAVPCRYPLRYSARRGGQVWLTAWLQRGRPASRARPAPPCPASGELCCSLARRAGSGLSGPRNRLPIPRDGRRRAVGGSHLWHNAGGHRQPAREDLHGARLAG